MTAIGWKLELRRSALKESLAGLRNAMRISTLPCDEMAEALNLKPEDYHAAYAAMTGYFRAKVSNAARDIERTIEALDQFEAEEGE